MQPILILVASAVSLSIAFWLVRCMLRLVFRTRSPNPLGVVLITAGVLLFLFRAVTFAVPLLVLGTVLLLRKNGGTTPGPATQTSKVRSAHLEMTLDHDTGRIDGRILTGERMGQVLSDLALPELLKFHAEIEMDEETVKLLRTYLDSAHPEWRDQEQENGAQREKTATVSKPMSRDDACQLLGIEAGCSQDEIRKAYHRLIKRVHPDSGGSAALMAQVTEARDRLLGDRA
jgi:hypothetical protein